MDDLRAHARPVELALEPLAQVGVGAVAVAGQLLEQRADRRDALAALLPDEAALRHLRRTCDAASASRPPSDRAGRSARAATGVRPRGASPSRRFPRRSKWEAGDQPF